MITFLSFHYNLGIIYLLLWSREMATSFIKIAHAKVHILKICMTILSDLD